MSARKFLSDLSVWAAAEYAIGRPFYFTPGQKVICNGNLGVVRDLRAHGMVQVCLDAGLVCVPASFPDCYPDPLDFIWRVEPDGEKWTLFNRMGRQFISLRNKKRAWHAETGESFSKRADATHAMEKWARQRIETECVERVSRATAFSN